jgi:hypothetical protein
MPKRDGVGKQRALAERWLWAECCRAWLEAKRLAALQPPEWLLSTGGHLLLPYRRATPAALTEGEGLGLWRNIEKRVVTMSRQDRKALAAKARREIGATKNGRPLGMPDWRLIWAVQTHIDKGMSEREACLEAAGKVSAEKAESLRVTYRREVRRAVHLWRATGFVSPASRAGIFAENRNRKT